MCLHLLLWYYFQYIPYSGYYNFHSSFLPTVKNRVCHQAFLNLIFVKLYCMLNWHTVDASINWNSFWLELRILCLNPLVFFLTKEQSNYILCTFLLLYSGLVMSNSLWPSWTIAHQSSLSMGFPGKITAVGSHLLLQGIFLTGGLKPVFYMGRHILYHWTT